MEYKIEKTDKKENQYSWSQTDASGEKRGDSWSADCVAQKWLVVWNQMQPIEPFSEWFVATYVTVCNKAQYYKESSKAKKRRVVLCFNLLFVLQIALLIFYFGVCYASSTIKVKADVLLALEAGFIIFGFLLVLPLTKRIDIDKHQETWARHCRQKERLEMEMLRYVSMVEPYDVSSVEERNKKFIERTIQTEEQTIETFERLLQQQEKGMLDEWGDIKLK